MKRKKPEIEILHSKVIKVALTMIFIPEKIIVRVNALNRPD
jgi:hypothetical protein